MRTITIYFFLFTLFMQSAVDARAQQWSTLAVTDTTAIFPSLQFHNGELFMAYKGASGQLEIAQYDDANGEFDILSNSPTLANAVDEIVLRYDGQTPYVAYKDIANSNKVSVVSYDGTNWNYVGNAGFAANVIWTNSLDMEIYNGEPYVVYIDAITRDVAVKKFDGNTWVDVGPAFTNNRANYTSLEFNNGVPYISYTENEKPVVQMFDGNTWVNVGNVSSLGVGDDTFYNTMRIVNGVVYLAYQDNSFLLSYPGQVSVVKYENNQWSYVGSQGISRDVGLSVELAIANNGDVYAAYRDQTNSGRLTVSKFDGASWSEIGYGVSGSTAREIQIELSPAGVPHVCFREQNDNRVYLKSFCSTTTSTVVDTACDEYLWLDGNFYNTSGVYTYTTTNYLGCDSIITLVLTVAETPEAEINLTVINGQDVLTAVGATSPNSTYSWAYDSMIIANGPEDTLGLSGLGNGEYYVQITSDGCRDVSEAFVYCGATQVPVIVQSENVLSVDSGYANYQWTLDSDTILGATGNTYTATVSGTYSVIVNNNDGCDVYADPVNILISGIENHTTDEIRLAPNPTTDKLTISLQPSVHLKEITLHNTFGQQIIWINPAGESNLVINTTNLATGMYFIRFKHTNGTITTRKVIVK